jgi:hypothetical protein
MPSIYLPDGIITVPMSKGAKMVMQSPSNRRYVIKAAYGAEVKLQMTAAAPDLSTAVWAVVHGCGGAATADVDLRRSFPLAEQRITPEEGGYLASADAA